MKKIIAIILVSLILFVGLPIMVSSAESAPEFTASGQIRSSSKLDEYNGVSAFFYWGFDYKYYIHIEDGISARDERVILSTGYCQPYNTQVVMLNEDEFILFWGVPIIKADHYKILPSGLEFLSRQDIGDKYSRFLDSIKVESGKILISWYEYYPNTECSLYVDIGFAYRTTDGIWITLPQATVKNNSHEYTTNGVLCQHPADNSIWSFTITDASDYLHAIHLTDKGNSISIDWVNSQFISPKDDKRIWRMGEIPFIKAIPDPNRNSILLVYQNEDYKFFSIKPFVKGSKICVVEVSNTGNKKLLFLLDRYVERISPIGLGILADGEFWLAYYPIDPNTLNYMNLHLMRSSNPGEEISLGQISKWWTLIHSNNRLLFNLTDGIYSYWVGEKPLPPAPTPQVTIFMGKAVWKLNGGMEMSAAMAIYSDTEVGAMNKLREFIISEFPEADITTIEFHFEVITANTFKVLE